MDDDSPWGDSTHSLEDSEWNKMSSGFYNVGYREGITAGKESALQQGFDDGFAQIGAPIGKQIGMLRGVASTLVSFLNSPTCTRSDLLQDVQAIYQALNRIRFSDIAPPDLEAEQHAREHLEAAKGDDDESIPVNEEIQHKRDMEALEDMLSGMGAGTNVSSAPVPQRPTMEDVVKLEARLRVLANELGLSFPAY